MKARITWVVEGDRNMAFFHNSALIRRRRNHITSMKDRSGSWLNGEQAIVVSSYKVFRIFSLHLMIVPLREIDNPPFGDVA